MLKQILELEWSRVVSERLSTMRKHWQPGYLDLEGFRRSMQKFAIKEKSILLVHSAGAAYTNDIICKYRFNISPMCPFCDQLDSRSHRLKCTALTPYCMAHTVSRQTLERMHPIAIEFGLEYVPHGVWQLWEKLQNRKLRITKPQRDPTVFTLFTDGTCTDQKNVLIRLSAGALNIKKGPYISKNIQASLVPGLEQSSARGELYGIILALEKFFASHIYTDYQNCVDKIRLLQTHGYVVPPSWSNQDLWKCIADLLADRGAYVHVEKIQAHATLDKLQEPIRELCWQNHQVDLAAKSVLLLRAPCQRLYKQILNKFIDQRARLHNYHKFLVSAANHRFSLTEDKENKFSLNPLMSTDNELILDIDWEKRDQVCQTQDNWPTTFIDALLQWVILLRWPHGEPVCPENDIPWCELYIDFIAHARTLAPTLIPGTQKCGVAARYASKTNPLVYHVSPMGRDISTFVICFKMLVRTGVIAMPFAYCTKALSARRLGFSAVKPGIAARPSLVGGLHAARWFQNTLTSTKKTRNDLSFTLTTPPLFPIRN